MANDQPISGVPRYEYLTLAMVMAFEEGGVDRASLALILREARGNLDDANYSQLQRDIRFFVLGERMP